MSYFIIREIIRYCIVYGSHFHDSMCKCMLKFKIQPLGSVNYN